MAEEKVKEKEETQDSNSTSYDWSNETPESLNMTLRVLMRKYPNQTTPVMKEIYDELQTRSSETSENKSEK